MSEPQTPGTGATTRKQHKSLKRRRLQILLELMGRAEAPERVAAAVALGVGVGFSPFMGFHFFVAILLAFLFRLNRFDAVLGSFAGNPWTLPPVYALGYRLGRAVLGYPPADVAPLQWQRILHHDFWLSFRGPAFGPRMASFIVGTTILAVAAGLVTYQLAGGVLKLYHRRHPHVAARAARRRELASFAPPREIEILPEDRVH